MNNINRTFVASLMVLLSSTEACNVDYLTEDQRAHLQSMALPALPTSPSNTFADNPAAAELGQQFFYDKRFSGPVIEASDDLGPVGTMATMSCATCHDPARGGAELKRHSAGVRPVSRCCFRPRRATGFLKAIWRFSSPTPWPFQMAFSLSISASTSPARTSFPRMSCEATSRPATLAWTG